MNFTELLNSEIFTWVILPALIFTARIFDVTLGTLRIIFVSRGKKFIAPLLGFFEVIIWLLAISQIMKQLDNFLCYIAYAGGFAAGNFIGIIIEEKLAIGIMVVRIILVKDECQIRERLKAAGYGVTVVDARGGADTEVKIVYTIIKRRDLDEVLGIINHCNSEAFYSVEDARSAYHGIFPDKPGYGALNGRSLAGFGKLLRGDRKRK